MSVYREGRIYDRPKGLNFLKILVFAIFITVGLGQTIATLQKLNEQTEAKCLDGSPASFYVRKGDPKKFIFLFPGGAWCGSGS